jgi:hypothetical protein
MDVKIMTGGDNVRNYVAFGTLNKSETTFGAPLIISCPGLVKAGIVYPKYKNAAKEHGEGLNGNEIIWAQNQHFKLYADGALYAVSDRYEKSPIPPSDNAESPPEIARRMLQRAIESMPKKGQKRAADATGKRRKTRK